MNHHTNKPGEAMLRNVATWLIAAGIWALVAGAITVLWPDATILALAILIGAYLVAAGSLGIYVNVRDRKTTPFWGARGALAGCVVIAGLLLWAWPDLTVWTLAIIVGVAFIVSGLGDITASLAWRKVLPGWGWWLASGVISLTAGVLALTWPGITVFALAILAGIYLVTFGVMAIAAAMRIRRFAREYRDEDGTHLVLDGIEVDVSEQLNAQWDNSSADATTEREYR